MPSDMHRAGNHFGSRKVAGREAREDAGANVTRQELGDRWAWHHAGPTPILDPGD
jgi:hypothetical protein